MRTRNLQLVAGKTFTVSLPRTWVERHGLSRGDEVVVAEQQDGTLAIATRAPGSRPTEYRIDAERHEDIESTLFALYYLGAETILLTHSSFPKELRARVRRCLMSMSGTEISQEESQRIEIRVLLDMQRVDITQLLYRMSLLIDSSLAAIEEGNEEELQLNEDELDRLYHLATKVITLSLSDAHLLASSHIKQVSVAPQLLLVAKRLENIGDELLDLLKQPASAKELRSIRATLQATMKPLLGTKGAKAPQETYRHPILATMARYLSDIHESSSNVILSRELMKE